MAYTPTIGLEIHAELKTKTKMFCSSRNDPDETRPNVNICPVCMAHPGTLPVINKEAVRHILRIGTSIGGKLADLTYFDRKNYFYPDIPKGYQISQYKHPLVSGGTLRGIDITRVHLEEDTARSLHDRGDHSLVDFNRAGVPLMELVTEPVIHNEKDAVAFAKELQLLLRTLGASEANLEKGEMRIEANISVSNSDTLGTKVEVKNLNSFRVVERAIAHEIKRQIEVLESGKKVVQETRGWNEARGETFSQRLKEESKDYRYFPEPDLPLLKLSEVSEFMPEAIAANLPELPKEKRARFKEAYGIKEEAVEVLIQNEELGRFFESALALLGSDKEAAQVAGNYLTSDVIGIARSKDAEGVGMLTPRSFAETVTMYRSGEVSSRGAKDLLLALFEEGGEAKAVVEEKGLKQKGDAAELAAVLDTVLAENAAVVAEYKAGKETALQFLVGQGMKKTKGSANPQMLAEILRKKLQG